MRKLLCLLLICASSTLFAQIAAFTGDGVEVSIDFSNYTGTGVAPDPTGGELNSNNWSILGMSDGPIGFGDSSSDGDFEGQTDGTGATGGGLYSYNNGTSTSLWVQPTSSDFTPGALILKLNNATGATVTSINLDYMLHVLNDGERSNSFNLTYSPDGNEFFTLPSVDYNSEEMPDGSLQSFNRFVAISDFNLPDGQDFYLQWTSDDVSGSGSRDEFGLSNILISPFTGNPSPIANFANGSLEVDEGVGEILFQVSLSETASCDVNISIDPSSTAQSDVDFIGDVAGTYSFGSDQTISIPVTIINDMVAESDETLVLNLEYASGDCSVGGGNQLAITFTDNDNGTANSFSIAEITQTNTDGNYLFEGQTVEVTGTVYGINLRPDTGSNGDGLLFTINDGTGGVAIFSLLEEFGYMVQEGDIIRVVGEVDNFLGLGEVIPSVIELISSGNPLPSPLDVLELNEETESELIRLEYVELVDPTQWQAGGSDFSVDLTNGIDVYEMRIDNQVDLYNTDPIEGLFNVVGIGGQFDPNAPFTEGYTIAPRSIADIEFVGATTAAITFESGGVELNESDAPVDQTINILLSAATDQDCVFNVVAHPSTTASVGIDFTLPDGAITIPANSTSASYTVSILADDEFEETESIWLALDPVSGNCQPSIPAFKRISILDDDEPQIPDVVSISSITQNDEDEVPLSSGFEVSVEGVVYGVNMRPAGLQFTIIDNTGGMGVFSSDQNFGYTVTEGDKLKIVGTMGHFSGLTQITPSAIEVLDINQSLVGASVVEELNEDSESLLVTLGCVKLSNPSQWSSGGSGFNVDVTNDEKEWTVRIDADIDLFNQPAPTGNFLVTGIGGQFDSSAPFDSGYQLLPRYAADIDDAFCPDDMDSGIADFSSAGLKLYPNPAFNEIQIFSEDKIHQVTVFNILGQEKLSQVYEQNQLSIDLNSLSSGTYFVKVSTESGVYQTKFIKR